jgi:hypothetical protein
MNSIDECAHENADLIVLVHGFGAARFTMWPLAVRLRARGFRVGYWHYHSLFKSIEYHATQFSQYLTQTLAQERRFHIVAHSMGGIITRAAINHSRPSNLGKVVLLAPPNAGSPIATLAATLFGRVLPPMSELSNKQSSYVNQLRTSYEVEIGVIAGKFDLLVPVQNTHLKNQSWHFTVNATHNSILVSKTACDKIVSFIQSSTQMPMTSQIGCGID